MDARVALAMARADEEAARVRREVLERELGAARTTSNAPAKPKRKPARPLPRPDLTDTDRAMGARLAREFGVPVSRRSI